MHTINNHRQVLLSVLLILTLALINACTGSSPSEPDEVENQAEEMDEEMEHEEMGEEMEHDDHDPDTIPNNGARIHIISPSDGATVKVGEDILVEVETENFPLGEENNHWHIYIDGSSWGMVTGANHDQVLRNLEPGEHEIATFMSIDTHEQLQDGDSITITVEE